MKNFILFCLLALGCAVAFSSPRKKLSEKNAGFVSPVESLDFYSAATMYFPENCEGDFWADSSYSFAYGAKARFTGIEARYFNSCGKTTGEELYQIDNAASYYDVFEKSRYSLSLDLKKFAQWLDAKVVFGRFSVYSRMSNPLLSTTVSPFVSSLGDAAKLSPSLPTKTSTKKDEAVFAGGAFHFIENLSNETVRFLPVQFGIYFAKNEMDAEKVPFIWTLNGGFLYKNFLKATTAFSFARWYEQRDSTAEVEWWSEIPVRNSSLYNSFMNETSVSIPHLKNKISFGITENAQSLGRYWLRDEAVFKAGGISVAAGAFISDNVFLQEKSPLVTTGGSKKYSIWQIKLVPEYRLGLKKGESIKFGAGGFLESKITNFQKENQFDSLDLKFSTGAKYSNKVQSFKLTGTVSNIEVRQHLKAGEGVHLPKISAATTYSHKFKNKRRLSLSAAASVQLKQGDDPNEWSESFRVYYYPSAAFFKSVSLGLSATQKKSGDRIQPFAKASFLFKLKKVRINADICVNSNFAFSE